MRQIPENSLLHILLKEWVPALITVLVGGFLVALLIPRCQANFEKSKAYETRRHAIVESSMKNFTSYLVNWQRLKTLAELGSSRKLTADESQRLNDAVNKRNETLILLFSDLDSAQLYFGPEVVNLIRQFKTWDRSHAKDRLVDLPPLEKWEDWKEKLLGTMVQELKSN